MTTTVIGLDGKTYRSKAMTTAQRTALVSRVHYLAHVRHMSVRGIVAELWNVNGLKVSVGATYKYLNKYCCEVCQVEES